MGKKVHFIELNKDEQAKLKNIAETAPAKTALRAKILLLSDSNSEIKLTAQQIADELKTSHVTVQIVRADYSKFGLEGSVFPKGMPSYDRQASITAKKRQAIVEIAHESPPDNAKCWTVPLLCKTCVERGLFEYIAPSAIKKILSEENLDILMKRTTNKKPITRQFPRSKIDGIYLVESPKYSSNNGTSIDILNDSLFGEAGIKLKSTSDILISAKKGSLHALTYRAENDYPSVVWVVSGEVYYVAVDLRKYKKTYKRWVGYHLSSQGKDKLFISRGFAHGYLILSDSAIFIIKNREGESKTIGIKWDDPAIGIQWPEIGEYIINDEDKHFPFLADLQGQI